MKGGWRISPSPEGPGIPAPISVKLERIVLGHVRELRRYPVKSMRGESLAAAEASWHGLVGDRRYAFTRGDYDGHFPWLTGREVPDLLRYHPTCAEPAQPKTAPISVRTPEGRELPIESEELRAELEAQYGGPVRLLHLGRGAFDSSPISLLTTTAMASFGAALGHTLDPHRFRANVLVELAANGGMEELPSDGRFPEDAWVGARLVFGERADSARIIVQRRITRCVMTTLDPETAEREPTVLKMLGQVHDTCAGVYAMIAAPGSIAVGDAIALEPA